MKFSGGFISSAVPDQPIADSNIDMLPVDNTGSFNLDNSEMSIINSYLNLDYIDNVTAGYLMSLNSNSQVYAYNMTIMDHIGDNNTFIFNDLGSQVYFYKWAVVPVVDSNNNPITGAGVIFTCNPASAADISYTGALNDLNAAPHANSDTRMLAYLSKVRSVTVTGANYLLTNSDGVVTVPLLTTAHSYTINVANGDIDGHNYGNYIVGVSYSAATADTRADFSPYPMITSNDNTVIAPLVEMMDITLELPDLTPGTITFTPATDINIGEIVRIDVTIDNVKSTNALDVYVQVFDHNIISGTTEIYNTVIDSIPGSGSNSFFFDYNFSVGGSHNIRVVVDFNNTVIEFSRRRIAAGPASIISDLSTILSKE